MKKVFVVIGPSGIGKTYLAEKIIDKYPSSFDQVKLFTTRQPRQNESFVDRIFISAEKFLEKRRAGDFFIAEKFHESWYGYTNSSLRPIQKNVIVNAWPALVPKFVGMPNLCFVGLTTSEASIDLLKKRMVKRDGNHKVVAERLVLADRDIADMRRVEDIIINNGKVFKVTDDQTISKEVIPWIEKHLT